MAGGRLLLVHAHPDDETIATGATMARYAAAGVQVTLVTCTLGEQGEILVPALAGLEAAQADQLGGYRMSEIAAALAELGVADHRYLGGAGAFRDSGMRGAAAAAHPRAFVRAAIEPVVFDEAVGALTEVVLDVRPHVIVTYDENGDYGHPDHVMAHRVTMAAVEAAQTSWPVPKVYWTATTRSAQQHDHDLTSHSGSSFVAVAPGDLDYGIDDSLVTTAIDASDFVSHKAAALAAYPTQVLLDGALYALSNNQGRVVSGVESYRLVRGMSGGARDDQGRETDLFGGLDVLVGVDR